MTSRTPPNAVHADKPNEARVYNYLIGGKDYFTADRDVAEQMRQVTPTLVETAASSRACLIRVVDWLTRQGVDQFLDIGSGLPSEGNVHEVAHSANPDARVMYVDNDPVAVAHARHMTNHVDGCTVVEADVRDLDTILDEAHQFFDWTRPVALVAFCLFHFVPDQDDPHGLVARFRDSLPAGSWLAMSHGASDVEDGTVRKAMERFNARAPESRARATARSRDQIARFFDGFDLVEPGLVFSPQWRPNDQLVAKWMRADVLAATVGLSAFPEKSLIYVGVARSSPRT